LVNLKASYLPCPMLNSWLKENLDFFLILIKPYVIFIYF